VASRHISVPAITFSELVDDLDDIDLVHFDTEGHDGEVLDQIDLDRWHPDIIMFEHNCGDPVWWPNTSSTRGDAAAVVASEGPGMGSRGMRRTRSRT